MFQNEMPYDPPNQAAWQHDGVLGWAAYKVADSVKTHEGWGLGSYCFFNQGVDIHAANGFVVPTTLAPGSVKHAFTIFLSTAGFGGIDHVINGTGGSVDHRQSRCRGSRPELPITSDLRAILSVVSH